MKKNCLLFIIFFSVSASYAEDGYRLWLRYDKVDDDRLLEQYRNAISCIHFSRTSPTFDTAKEELINGLQGLLDKKIFPQNKIENGTVLVGLASDSIIHSLISSNIFNKIDKEGFVIETTRSDQRHIIIIAGNTDVGALYGCFHFLRLLQTHQDIQELSVVSAPLIELRMLDHWDNLNRTVERGYAGISIWNWQTLPGYIDKRYIDYARANASIGINGTV